MPLPFDFDYKNPDYPKVFVRRAKIRLKLERKPPLVEELKLFYKDNIGQFIIDWGCTFEPRNVERGLPALIPFLLFPKQEEWIDFFLDCWRNQKPGLTEKTRNAGLSWLFVETAVSLCLFYDGVNIGFGSRKEEYVDASGDPKSLFYKARAFLKYLPKIFRGGYDERKNTKYMRIDIPETQSCIVGEAGDNMGRGNRSSVYFVDEHAWVPRAELVDAALSETTNCCQYISTPHGMNNSFAQKRHSGKIPVFVLAWEDDPRKDQAWYDKKVAEIDNPVIVAQEIDRSYTASVEGVVIPGEWVNAAVDAHIKLGLMPSGKRKAGFDVADRGNDLNSFVGAYGILVEFISKWSGKNSDILFSVQKVSELCDVCDYDLVIYDTDGVGAGVRGDARLINEERIQKNLSLIEFTPFDSAHGTVDPDGEVYPNASSTLHEKTDGLLNKDYFANLKAQGWWDLRKRFLETFRAVVLKRPYDPDNIISISSTAANYRDLVLELSQPTFKKSVTGKIMVDKAPDNSRSPNLADALMMCFARNHERPMGFFDDL